MPKNPQLIHSSTSQHLQQPNHPITSNFPHKSVTRIHHTANWPSRKQVETTWHPMEFQQLRMGVSSLQINCHNLGRHRWKIGPFEQWIKRDEKFSNQTAHPKVWNWIIEAKSWRQQTHCHLPPIWYPNIEITSWHFKIVRLLRKHNTNSTPQYSTIFQPLSRR